MLAPVRLGIIGIGNMGSSHASQVVRGLVPNLVLAAVADRSAARRDWAKENLPTTVEIFSEGTDLINSGKVDAVIVAIPHYDHPAMSIAAMKNGLHTLCEKPAGVYTRQVREMNEVAKASPVIFGMMFNQRTNPLYRAMKDLISSGELGPIKRVSWIVTDWYRSQSYYDSGSWRATWAGEGGGVLMNQAPHNIDLLQWICGLPTKVSAFCHTGKWHNIEVEDDVTAYFEFANGATGTFVTATADAPGTNRFEITCDGGKLVCEDNTLTLWRLKMGEREFNATYQGGFGQPEFTQEIIPVTGENLQHVGVMRAFTDAILANDKSRLIAAGEEGIRGLMLSNSMLLSSWLGHPVDLPIDEQLYFELLQERVAASNVKPATEAKTFNLDKSFQAT
jgi:predicted dehydrogenase